MTDAKVRIVGSDETAAAWRSAVGQADSAGRKIAGLMRLAFAGVSIGAITGAIGRSIEFGDELGKAAAKSGIATKAFSELAHAAKMVDGDISSLSIAIKNSNVFLSQVSTGNKENALVLRALGLEFEHFRALQPDKRFEVLGDAVKKLKDPMDQARAGSAIFGKTWESIAPLFEDGAEGIRKAREEAVALGKSLDESQVKRLQEADDAMKRLAASGSALGDTFAIKLAPGIASVADQIRLLLGGGTVNTKDLETEIALWRRLADAARLVNPALGVAAEITFSRRAAAARELIEANQRQRHLEALSRGPGLSATAPGFAEADALEQAKKDAEELANFIDGLSAKSEDALEREVKEASEEITRSVDFSVGQIGRLDEAAEKEQRSIEEMYAAWDTETMTSLELQKKAIEAFSLKLESLVLDGLDPKVAAQRLAEFKKSFDTFSVYADQAVRNMQDAFAQFLFDPFKDGLRGMLKGFIDIIRRMVAETAAAKIFGSKSSGGLGVGDFISAGVSNLFGFQHGGSFEVPGSGSTDSVVPLFRATPGERVTVSPKGKGGAGIHFAPVYNTTITGDATERTMATIRRGQIEASERSKAELIELLEQNGYAIIS